MKRLPAMIGLLVGLMGATALGGVDAVYGQDPPQQDSLLLPILRAATGRYAEAVSMVPERSSFEWIVGPEFFAARALGPHDIEYVGMVAHLPDGTMLPLGCPATRRMLTPYIRFKPDAPADSILAYAIELAQLDGAIPFEPVVWRGPGSRGFSLVPPTVLSQAKLPHVSDAMVYRAVTFYVRGSPDTMTRVLVFVAKGANRWDDVVAAYPVHE